MSRESSPKAKGRSRSQNMDFLGCSKKETQEGNHPPGMVRNSGKHTNKSPHNRQMHQRSRNAGVVGTIRCPLPFTDGAKPPHPAVILLCKFIMLGSCNKHVMWMPRYVCTTTGQSLSKFHFAGGVTWQPRALGMLFHPRDQCQGPDILARMLAVYLMLCFAHPHTT